MAKKYCWTCMLPNDSVTHYRHCVPRSQWPADLFTESSPSRSESPDGVCPDCEWKGKSLARHRAKAHKEIAA